MADNDLKQSLLDDEHLRLLALGYKVSAGVSAFTSLFGLMYMIMGLVFGVIGAHGGNEAPPVAAGWMFGLIGFAIFASCIVFGLLQWRTAACLEKRESPTFCMVIAAINCMGMPWGTVLGVFTFVVLGRESVKRLFEQRTVPAAAIK